MDMNGALIKASNRFAIAAALGLALGAGSAKAADLVGNCCADLEERVAELEATTARKGNRKMSLTITGQVHRMVLWWDDGHNSGTYYGLDNTNSSSRFSLLGEAKISPRWKTGFEIMIEIEAGGTSSKVSQFDEDGKVGSQIGGSGSFNQANVDAYFGDARRAAWWIEDKSIGRLTVGRYESAGVVTTIDLGGIGAAASSSLILVNGSFALRDSAGAFTAMNWNSIGDPAAAGGRTEGLRWDSPLWAGFTASASVGERGDYWGAMLRYAGEFSGFRVAAGIGYEDSTDRATSATADPTDQYTGAGPEAKAWGGSVAVMHVPTGLFAQGQYMSAEYSCNGATSGGYWGQVDCKSDSDLWQVQAGIAKNWTGLGNTSIYGEYAIANGWGAATGAGRDYAAVGTRTAVTGVTDTELTVWGLGVVQHVDSAATELYLGWRRFEADVTSTSGQSIDNFDAVMGGARIKF
jgi:hypothetical protein